MDASHTWHPGSVDVKPQWVISTPVFPDELLSSWLIRAAHGNGCDPISFAGAIWPGWRAWTRDIDRIISDERLAKLLVWSNIDSHLLDLMTISSVSKIIQNKKTLNTNTVWIWLLSIGVRNRSRHGGLQYCPDCLRSDPVPYYRIFWRFAWHTVCEKHGCQLIDRCMHCGHPLEPHLLEASSDNIGNCSSCGNFLGDTSKTESDISNLLRLQQRTNAVLSAGCGNVYGECVVAHQWFKTLSFFMNLIRASMNERTACMGEFENSLHSDYDDFVTPDVFENLQTSQRVMLLDRVGALLSLKFDALVQLLQSAAVSRQNLVQCQVPSVRIIDKLISLLPDRKQQRNKLNKENVKPKKKRLPPPRSKREVERMMRKLFRKMKDGNL